MQVSVARYLRTPPYAAKRKDLVFDSSDCLRSHRHRSTVVVCNCTFGPITVVPYRVKAGLFERSSILFRPRTPETPGGMVESPGTAPGSEPSITGAFITIVWVTPSMFNIGRAGLRHKRVRLAVARSGRCMRTKVRSVGSGISKCEQKQDRQKWRKDNTNQDPR